MVNGILVKLSVDDSNERINEVIMIMIDDNGITL